MRRVFGWVLTAAFTTLGAPFWFDLLGRLVSVRGNGNKPAPAAADDRSATARVLTAMESTDATKDLRHIGTDTAAVIAMAVEGTEPAGPQPAPAAQQPPSTKGRRPPRKKPRKTIRRPG